MNGSNGIIHMIIYAAGSKLPDLHMAMVGIFNDYIGPPFLQNFPSLCLFFSPQNVDLLHNRVFSFHTSHHPWIYSEHPQAAREDF